jgi:hypothetical protein
MMGVKTVVVPRVVDRHKRVAPGEYWLRVFMGTDPVIGSPRQITRTVQTKTQRQAQQILAGLRDDVATAEPIGSNGHRSLVNRGVAGALQCPGPRPKTRNEPASRRRGSFSPALDDVPIVDLTPRHLNEIYGRLVTGEERPRPLKTGQVSKGTMPCCRPSLGQAVR